MRYVRDLYSPVFFVEYLVAIMVLCISLYLTLTISEYDYEFGIICLMWAHKLPQLFLYSWFGTKLSDVAHSVRNAAYACEWHNTSKSISICILIVMIRCDQRFAFIAGDYASVTVNSFAVIMKEAVSYMAVMHTLMSSDEDQMANVTLRK
ncbi:odorant receptor coreceptor [Anabrus simplex]|uniref:odorant receptor coreceptor n=1 Tax=Anabrus simplex TaxID=316456 RepID=UPI0035A312E8